jgi:hypothetical protein
MKSGIFLVQSQLGNGQLIKMNEKAYKYEDVLQKLLASYPDLLPGDQIDPDNPRHWLFIGREISVGNGSLDHLFIDQDAIPTLVEVKRGENRELRRQVIGQILEYATYSSQWTIEQLKQIHNATLKKNNSDSDKEIVAFLAKTNPSSNLNIEDFWASVESNLITRKIRLLIVADRVSADLKDIITFLNQQLTTVDILVVEIPQYANIDNSVQTFVPLVHGKVETTASIAKSSYRKVWDELSFFEELAKTVGPQTLDTARKIYNWAKEQVNSIGWGTGKDRGTLIPKIFSQNKDRQIFQLTTTGGWIIWLGGGYYDIMPPFNEPVKREELIAKLQEVFINEPISSEEAAKPEITKRISSLNSPEKLQKFQQTFEWVIDEVKKANAQQKL